MFEIAIASVIISGLLCFILGYHLGIQVGMQRPKTVREALSTEEEQDVIHLRSRTGLNRGVCDLPMLIVGTTSHSTKYHLYSSSPANACPASRQLDQNRNSKRITACAHCFGGKTFNEPVR